MKKTVVNLLFLIALLAGLNAFSQEVQLNEKITNNYQNLSVSHQLLKAGGKTTVYSRMRNTQYEPLMGIVYTITPIAGAARQIAFVMDGNTFHAQNLDEVQSFTVSVAAVTAAEKNGRDWISRTEEVEIVSVRGDKLFSRLLSPDKKPVAPALANTAGNKDEESNDIAETRAVLDWFFGSGSTKGIQLNSEDKRIADEMFTALVDGSCKMTFVESINPYSVASYASASKFIRNVALRILSNGYTNCYKDAKNGKYSRTVRDKILAKYRTPFANRKQNGEWLL